MIAIANVRSRPTATAWVIAIAITGALALSCGGPRAFVCAQDEQCVQHGALGRCEANGYCSFPDPACPSESRYADHAPSGIAGQCVPIIDDDGDGVATQNGHADDDSADPTAPTDTDPGVDPSASAGSDPSGGVDAPDPSDGGPTSDDPTHATATGDTSTSGDQVTSGDPTNTTAGEGDPYGECLQDADCTYPQASCMMDEWALPLCNPPCAGAQDSASCPDPIGGTAVPRCADIVGGPSPQWACVLDCTRGACPPEMFCVPSTIGPFCMWA